MIVPARARELIEDGCEAGAVRPEGRRALRPRQAVRGQGRVQEHDRREADALPARRRVPRRPHDRVHGPTTGGRPGSSSSSSTVSASRRRSPSCRAWSAPRSPRARRCPARTRGARRATSAHPSGQRCSGVRLSMATTPPGATSSSARSLSARIWAGGLRFQPPPSKNRRSNGASGGSTSCQSPCSTRTFGRARERRAQAAARSSSTSTVTNDALEPIEPETIHAAPTPGSRPDLREPCRSGEKRRARRAAARPRESTSARSPAHSASASARRTSSGTWPTDGVTRYASKTASTLRSAVSSVRSDFTSPSSAVYQFLAS